MGAVSEIIVDGMTGRVVPRDSSASTIAAAVETVLSESWQMGAMTRRRCLERFELSAVAEQWMAMLNRVRL